MPPLHVDRPSRPRRVRFSLESMGLRRALHEIAPRRWPYVPETDRWFDTRHGTDTAGTVQTTELGIADGVRRGQAIRYLPSPHRVTKWMLDRIDVDPTTHTFVDMGCGKGRVLLLAAQRPFRAVIGLEISSQLAEIARRNVEAYRPPPTLRSAVEVIEGDATTVDLPTSDLLVHFYHPFEPDVTTDVLRRLEASLAHSARKVTIAYLAYTAAVPPVSEVLGQFGWLHRRRHEQSVRGHYNWLIYGN